MQLTRAAWQAGKQVPGRKQKILVEYWLMLVMMALILVLIFLPVV
jgi:hypothetical protein